MAATRRPGRRRRRRPRSRPAPAPPWRSVAYATKPPSPEPTIATRALSRGLLDGAGEQALDEVALEGEEDRQRDRERDERGRRDQLDVRAELAQLREDRDRDRLRVAGRRSARRAGRSTSRGTGRSRARRSPAGRAAGSAAGRSAPRRRRRSAPTRGGPRGIPMKKLRSRKIANGSPNAVWKRISPSTVSNRSEVVVEREDRDQRHLQRHDEQRDHADEEPVAAREVEPGERVAGERGDDDRQDGAADRDLHRRPERRGDRLVVEDLRRSSSSVARLGSRDDLPPALFGEVCRRASSEVKKRPIVGTSHSTPTITSRRCTGALPRNAQDPRRAALLALAARQLFGDGRIIRPPSGSGGC